MLPYAQPAKKRAPFGTASQREQLARHWTTVGEERREAPAGSRVAIESVQPPIRNSRWLSSVSCCAVFAPLWALSDSGNPRTKNGNIFYYEILSFAVTPQREFFSFAGSGNPQPETKCAPPCVRCAAAAGWHRVAAFETGSAHDIPRLAPKCTQAARSRALFPGGFYVHRPKEAVFSVL